MILATNRMKLNFPLTFKDFVCVAAFAVPWWIAMLCEIAEFQVADRESDD